MRVLDLGTGLGHVAFDVANLVGQRGTVVGIDQSRRLLDIAEHRRLAAGIDTSHSLRPTYGHSKTTSPLTPSSVA
jgi:ubiquinone/menaquinone biosynthesis C-methylase UbiE